MVSIKMRHLNPTAFIFLSIVLFSCQNSVSENNGNVNSTPQIVVSELQSILDSLNIEGAVLIYDKEKDSYYSNNFNASNVESLPASTFKIPNSIIGLELNIFRKRRNHIQMGWRK